MIRKALIGVSIALAGVGMALAVQPPTFHVERSIVVKAPAENAYALVNDLHQWRAWSPFEEKDPNLTRTYSGARSGAGAVYGWSGNGQIGEGKMTIERSEPAKLIGIELEFIKPFRATNTATFTFTPMNGETKVTWAMDGENTLIGKVAHLFFDMDKALGSEFEHGLEKLKANAERSDLNVASATNH